jgi:hypothetical protein
MKYLIIPLLLTLTACASTSGSTQRGTPEDPIVVQRANEELSANLFSEAHRCQGTVKYQAEIQNNNMRSRLTCVWEVEPDQWGSWE